MENKRGIASGKIKKKSESVEDARQDILIPKFVNKPYNESRRLGELIEGANGDSTQAFKRSVQRESVQKRKKNIKTKPKTISNQKYYDKDKKIRRIFAVIGAGIVLLGGYIAWRLGGSNQPEPINVPTPPGHTDVMETNPEHTETVTGKDTSKGVEDINSIYEVRKDLKERYIKEYNEKYGTEYSSYDIEIVINKIQGGEVYELSDNTEIKHVTLGSTPAITLNALKELGQVSKARGYNEIIQIIVPDQRGGTEHILGSYNVSTGEFIYSGNQLEDVSNLEFDPPTLEKLGINPNILREAAEVMLADGIENEKSIEYRIDDYKEAIRDTGVEPGD